MRMVLLVVMRMVIDRRKMVVGWRFLDILGWLREGSWIINKWFITTIVVTIHIVLVWSSKLFKWLFKRWRQLVTYSDDTMDDEWWWIVIPLVICRTNGESVEKNGVCFEMGELWLDDLEDWGWLPSTNHTEQWDIFPPLRWSSPFIRVWGVFPLWSSHLIPIIPSMARGSPRFCRWLSHLPLASFSLQCRLLPEGKWWLPKIGVYLQPSSIWMGFSMK